MGAHLPEEDATVWSSAGHVDPISADSHSREPHGRDQPMLDRLLRDALRDQLPREWSGNEERTWPGDLRLRTLVRFQTLRPALPSFPPSPTRYPPHP
jgi:hypothetical protein